MKTQLLCTFSSKSKLESTFKEIINNYTIVFGKVYVLQNEDNVDELICTYNVDTKDGVDYNKVHGTISLHRKKHTNTLYTINALNEVIKNLNNGVLDKNLNVPWENFRNTVLVINKDGLNRISTRIYKILSID
jgi:hypothetical protein